MTNQEKHEALADEYLDVTGTKRLFTHQMDKFMFALALKANANDPEEAELMKKMREAFSYTAIKPIMISAITEIIPVDIMEQIIEFYKSPAGKFVSKNNVEIHTKMEALMQEHIERQAAELFG